MHEAMKSAITVGRFCGSSISADRRQYSKMDLVDTPYVYSQSPPTPRFVVDPLAVARPNSPGVDGDWEKVFRVLQSHPRGSEYFISEQRRVDEFGKSLLHYACSREKRKDALDAAKVVFEYCDHYGMTKQDVIDYVNLRVTSGPHVGATALQLATENRNMALVKVLMEHGADIYLLKKKNIESVQMIYDKVLIKIFNGSIKIHKDPEDTENDTVWDINCEFGPITGWHNKTSAELGEDKTLINQTGHLARVIRQEKVTRAAILQHPLVQIFLHIKGEKFAILLYTSMIYHILWSLVSFAFIFCNTHILDSTNIVDTSRSSNLTAICQSFQIYNSRDSTKLFAYSAYFYIMILLFIGSVAKEIVELYICQDKWYYWKQLENLGQWGVNVTMLVVWVVAIIVRTEKTDDDADPDSFLEESHFLWVNLLPGIYVAGMFASLLLIQGQLTKTELLGVYNEMFVKGFLNIIKFLLAFLPLMIAFLITFHLLLPMRREFLPSWGLGFSKLLAMMTGEVGYDDVFYGEDEDEIAFKNILKILFLVFIVTVVILLQNLLIGMTVSDVQKMEAQARVNSLACRLEDIYLMENLVTHRWVIKMFQRFEKEEFYRKLLIVTKADTQIVETKSDGRIETRNKRLDEYPAEIREALIYWDREAHSE